MPSSHFIATLGAALAIGGLLPAHAGLVRMTYTGSVGQFSTPDILADDFPAGTPVGMQLTYDDSFLGQPATTYFLGMSPAISGTMTLGALTYAVDSMQLTQFQYGPTAADPSPFYGFMATGSGPATDDGETFTNLLLIFNSQLPGAPVLVSFNSAAAQGGGSGYLTLRAGSVTHEFLPNAVPAPGTLALCLAGLGAWGVARPVRRRAAVRPQPA